MQVTCPGLVFGKSVRLMGHELPQENPSLPLPLCMRFDDGSAVLIKTPILVHYASKHKKSSSVPLHAVIAWARALYISLWKIKELDWYHAPEDAIIDSLFKNNGDVAWRLGFSF